MRGIKSNNMGDQRWPLSQFPPPDGVSVLCFDNDCECGEIGIVVLDGHLHAFNFASSGHDATLTLLPAGQYMSRRMIDVFLRKGRWLCEVCTRDNGLRRAKDCIHCRAARWIEWYRLSH